MDGLKHEFLTRDMKPGHIQLGGASLELAYSPIIPAADRHRVFEVTNLFTLPTERRNNCANSLMQEVCEQADQFDKFLLLMPQAYGDEGLTTEQLVDWYTRKFRFVYLQNDPVILIRMPRTAAQRWADDANHR